IAATAGGGVAVGALVQPHPGALGADGGAPFGLARHTQTSGGAAHRHPTDRRSPARRPASPLPGERVAAGAPQPAGPTLDPGAQAARAAGWPRAVPAAAIGGSQALASPRPSHVPAPVSAPSHRAAT